jgi:hypothetical protein
MSAYIVSKSHIDALVNAAGEVIFDEHASGLNWYHDGERHELGYGDRVQASYTGQMLWAANLSSINCRYPDTIDMPSNCPGPNDFNGMETVEEYMFKPTPRLSAVAILKAIDCYVYQSCEDPTFYTSEAYAFCEALRRKMTRQLPGYGDAPWEIREEHVRQFAGI